MLKHIPLLVISIFFICACSHEQIYSATHENRRFECQKLPQPQYEACMKEYDQPYDDYNKSREDALKNKE